MAQSIGVSRATIERRILNGEIASERRGDRHRIPLGEVERLRHAYAREMAHHLAADFQPAGAGGRRRLGAAGRVRTSS
jgi:excisionase family DNA binding protein